MLDGERPDAQPPVIWACNAKPVALFMAMRTQWRVGMAGPTGLDYAALPVVAKALGQRLSAKRLADLQVMERAALAAMSEQRNAR